MTRVYEKDLEIECKNWHGGEGFKLVFNEVGSLGFVEKVVFIYIFFYIFTLKPPICLEQNI